jgi:hypothetical protein
MLRVISRLREIAVIVLNQRIFGPMPELPLHGSIGWLTRPILLDCALATILIFRGLHLVTINCNFAGRNGFR